MVVLLLAAALVLGVFGLLMGVNILRDPGLPRFIDTPDGRTMFTNDRKTIERIRAEWVAHKDGAGT